MKALKRSGFLFATAILSAGLMSCSMVREPSVDRAVSLPATPVQVFYTANDSGAAADQAPVYEEPAYADSIQPATASSGASDVVYATDDTSYGKDLDNYESSTEADVYVVIVKPPVVRVETRPSRPHADHVWIPGHWAFRHGHWVWVSGRWAGDHPGQSWVSGYWDHRGNSWVWVPGHWAGSQSSHARGNNHRHNDHHGGNHGVDHDGSHGGNNGGSQASTSNSHDRDDHDRGSANVSSSSNGRSSSRSSSRSADSREDNRSSGAASTAASTPRPARRSAAKPADDEDDESPAVSNSRTRVARPRSANK